MELPLRVRLASDWVRYGTVLLFGVLIIYFSLANPAEIGMQTTPGEVPHGPFGIDIGPLGWFETDVYGHGMVYTVYTGMVAYAFVAPVQSHPIRYQRLVLTVCTVFVFGVCLELAQGMTGYRGMKLIEAISNGLGASLMATIWWRMDGLVRFVDVDGEHI